MSFNRLPKYFAKIDAHIALIDEALEVLQEKLPINDYKNLSSLEKFALNTLIFRFSKLQDLLGSKVFRSYLEYSGFETSEKSFFELLKEIEKEGIVDIDTWDELRKLRNQIAHEYLEEEDEAIEKINLFIQRSQELINIANRLREHYLAIERARKEDH